MSGRHLDAVSQSPCRPGKARGLSGSSNRMNSLLVTLVVSQHASASLYTGFLSDGDVGWVFFCQSFFVVRWVSDGCRMPLGDISPRVDQLIAHFGAGWDPACAVILLHGLGGRWVSNMPNVSDGCQIAVHVACTTHTNTLQDTVGAIALSEQLVQWGQMLTQAVLPF